MSNPYMPLTKLDKALDAAVKIENDRAIADGLTCLPTDVPTDDMRRRYEDAVREALNDPHAFDFLFPEPGACIETVKFPA